VRAVLLIIAVLALAAGEAPRDSERDRAAAVAIADLDRQLDAIRRLDAPARQAKEAGLGRTLERTAEKVAGTKHEGKALYLLANWRMTHAEGKGVDEALDALDRCAYPGFKSAGSYLRVLWRLRQGRVVEARTLAEPLAVRIPEFAGALALVAFHERIGQKPARTAGRDLLGGDASRDGAARPEPWLLWLFVGGIDDAARDFVQPFLSEAAKPAYRGKLRVVCVTAAANPLLAVTAFRQLPDAGADLLWADPGEGGSADEWAAAWALPTLPCAGVLGPDRALVAVMPRPEDLRALVGPADASERPAGDGRVGKPGTR